MERNEHKRLKGLGVVAVTAVLVLHWPGGHDTSWGQELVIQDFKQNCASCHTIGGGRITGPDLKDLEAREGHKDRDWLVRFIMDPVSVLNSGDSYALKLQEEARGAVMPGLPGMTRARAEALLDLIAAESKLEKSQFAGVQISERALTEEDIARGKGIFTGKVPLKAGGAACLSCHTMSGLGIFGGGLLGPDLTKVFERRQGRKGLVAWLSAPATPMMQATFKDHALEGEEILALVAWFKDRSQYEEPSTSSGTLLFVLLGFVGAIASLFLIGRIWNYRIQRVRQTLIRTSKVKATS